MISHDTVAPVSDVMVTPHWVRTYRLGFAALTVGAVVFQFWYRSRVQPFSPSNFWSFFTIQSNLFAALVLLWAARGAAGGRSPATVDLVRGAAVLYMSITGVVYGVLLTGYEDQLQTAVPWVNNVLHRVMPIVMVLDWLIDPPRGTITVGRALIWLLYPLAYAITSLLRGPIVGWYPYPFLNPEQVGGYGIVALYCVAIAVASAVFAWLVVLVGTHVRLVVAT